ncbi:hypothetical protein CANARDRAFT_29588 [[Candida] arabinofermentans NRRL YB-2248]|uniref:Maf-like protein n=1 Tax=[Candida] arabinofermentans NRRL YB-2248 TaxID=983967 RepID=A0A1E4SWH5_9ASCO|nr:hypothetical protein CANARDRAFT_29588 [[Candida] arabinofermentans NRRL YB-2248]
MMGFNPIVKPSNFEEDLNKDDFKDDISEYALQTSIGKIMDVWNELNSIGDKSNIPDNLIMLSTDTIVENEGQIFEKPSSSEENYKAMIQFRDSSKPVNVISGVCILIKDVTDSKGYRLITFKETTEVLMDRQVTDSFLQKYSESGEGLQVAGGMKVQGFGGLMIEGFKGDFYNVVGLPYMRTFKEICKALDVDP